MPYARMFSGTLLIVFAITGDLSAATVRFESEVRVNGTVIRLKDIANVSDGNPDVRKRLENIVLGPAPPAGRTKRMDFSAIRSRLQAFGVDLSRIQFSGSKRVLITRAKRRNKVQPTSFTASQRTPLVPQWQQQKAEQRLARAVQDHLQRVAPQLGEVAVTVQLAEKHTPSVLTAKQGTLSVQGLRQPLERPQQMSARFLDDTGQTREVRFTCRVERKPFVLAAKVTIRRGNMIQSSDLTWQQVDSTDDAGDAITDSELVVGREATRTIRQGAVLKSTDVRRVPLVRTNDIVTVYSRRPGITIKREMKARGTAALGEMVTLTALRGRETVRGRVIGLHKAEVLTSNETARRMESQAGGSGSSKSIVFRRATPASQSDRLRSLRRSRLQGLTRQRFGNHPRGSRRQPIQRTRFDTRPHNRRSRIAEDGTTNDFN